jgi:hypothetical protein
MMNPPPLFAVCSLCCIHCHLLTIFMSAIGEDGGTVESFQAISRKFSIAE